MSRARNSGSLLNLQNFSYFYYNNSQCSDFLLQMFTSGKFGWQFGQSHEVHVGSLMLGSSPAGGMRTSRAAENGRISRMEESAKATGPIIAACRSTVANQG